MVKIYHASDFFQIANEVYRIAGWNYNLNTNSKYRKLQDLYYWTSNSLFVLIIIQSFTYLLKNIGKSEKFLDVTEIILCLGFMIMLIIKSYFVVYRNRKIFTEIIDDLDVVIPKGQYVQHKYDIKSYYKRARIMSIICSITYTSLLVSFILMPIMDKIIGSLFGSTIEWQLPFKFYFPFDPTQRYIYPALYVYESFLCCKCGIEVLGSDLLFCNITSIIAMRLEMLKEEIIQVDARDSKESVEKLKEYIQIHQHLIAINEKLEKLYSFCLLSDLFASTVITCLAAFNAFVRHLVFKLILLLNFFLNSWV